MSLPLRETERVVMIMIIVYVGKYSKLANIRLSLSPRTFIYICMSVCMASPPLFALTNGSNGFRK